MATEFNGLDLILGGHDHINLVEKVNGTYVIKSGADFVEFNKINLTVLAPESIPGLPQEVKDQIYKDRFLIDIKPIIINKNWEPNEELQKYVQHYLDQFQEKMKTVRDLNGRINSNLLNSLFFIHQWSWKRDSQWSEVLKPISPI